MALPLSAIPTFWIMGMLGFSLNAVSLLAITLVTGILVDDAIVEIENIVRHMRMGKSAWRASLEAADEIGLAVIAISMTIVAVFAPVSFMGGIPGQYFRQFGLTVAIAVFFSLLVARFLTPVFAAYFLRSHADHEEREGPAIRAYVGVVRWSVRHRWLTLTVGLSLFGLSIWSTRLLPQGLLPAEDTGRSLLAIELPPGSQLGDTERVTRALSAKLKTIPEVRSVLVYGGQILGGTAEVRKATLVVNLVHKSRRTLSQQAVQGEMGADAAAVPDIRYWFLKDNGQRDLQVTVAGRDIKAIGEAADQLASEMRALPIFKNPTSTAELDRPELQIRPKPGLAADLGLSTEALSETIRVATLGDVDANLPKFNAGDRLIPIRVELDERARSRLDVLRQLRVPTATGGVPLDSVADFDRGRGPTAINRYDRSRRVTVEADMTGQHPLGEGLAALYALPTAQHMPAGTELKQSGDAEIMNEVFSSFLLAIGAGLMMVYGVLILLFGSFTLPITILFSLPLSVGGAILALLVTDKPFSMPVVIGILMLMGIVTKNAIMLIDFAVVEIRHGTPRLEALVEAGRKRARPIVMTTIAMVAGMLPSAFAYGDGGEFRAPMAIAVIGGLLVSTVLSLLFVRRCSPCSTTRESCSAGSSAASSVSGTSRSRCPPACRARCGPTIRRRRNSASRGRMRLALWYARRALRRRDCGDQEGNRTLERRRLGRPVREAPTLQPSPRGDQNMLAKQRRLATPPLRSIDRSGLSRQGRPAAGRPGRRHRRDPRARAGRCGACADGW